METKQIPTEKVFDSSLDLMKDGYNFIRKRCEVYKSDIFKTRVMFQSAICVSGVEAAALVYDNMHFVRKGAAPRRVQKTLFGERGVQTLDDALHRQRKEMFLSLMGAEQISQLASITQEQWLLAASQWEGEKLIYLLDEVQKIMCIVACQWTGVPIKSEDVPKHSKEFGSMVDAFGGVGPRHLKGKTARKSSERWIRNMISQVRGGWLSTVPGSAMYTISFYKESGKLLDLKVAAVELINILRPIVAIANFVVFAALAMHQHPATQEKIIRGHENYVVWFVQEIRRFYPFTPFVGARVRDAFNWKGYHFPKGRLVLLDVYGTDRDPRKWERPEEFWPERFKNFTSGAFDFIPQDGGDDYTNHRCAGEWITIEATKVAVKFLATCIEYKVPDQDLSIDLSRMPTFPKSHFVITNVKVKKSVYQVI